MQPRLRDADIQLTRLQRSVPQDIEETGKFRELAATAPYMLRSQMIESQRLSESHDLQNRERQHREYGYGTTQRNWAS